MNNSRTTVNRLALGACALMAACAIALGWTALAHAATENELDQALQKTEAVIAKDADTSFGNEWSVFCLARANAPEHATYLNSYLKAIDAYVAEKNGVLSKTKSTEYSRVILAVTAAGKRATNIGGYNLIAALADQKFVENQGLNGTPYALLALDSKQYAVPELPSSASNDAVRTTRDGLIASILSSQLEDGGWAFSGSSSDTDMTAIALQALAPYKDKSDVKAAIEKAVAWLSAHQTEQGDFATSNTANAESTAQAIVALCALNIDPADASFTKNGKTALDGLMRYAVSDGGFKHIINGSRNNLATIQGFYALVAYQRYQNHEVSLFNMSDAVTIVIVPSKTPDENSASSNQGTTSANNSNSTSTNKTTSTKDKKTTKPTTKSSSSKTTKSTKTTTNSAASSVASTQQSHQPPATSSLTRWNGGEDEETFFLDEDFFLDEGEDDEDDEDFFLDEDDELDEFGQATDTLFPFLNNNGYDYWGQLPEAASDEPVVEFVLSEEEQAEAQRQLLITIGAVLATLAGAALVALAGHFWQLRCERHHAG